MAMKDRFTKALAVCGTLFVCIPFLLPVFFWIFTANGGHPRSFDFLLPAEFFPLALIGALLLFWAARRTGAHRRLVGWSLLIAASSLVLGQVLAVVSGLADGTREPSGLLWMLVMASIGVYITAMLFVIAGGILLINDLFKPGTSQHQPTLPMA